MAAPPREDAIHQTAAAALDVDGHVVLEVLGAAEAAALRTVVLDLVPDPNATTFTDHRLAPAERQVLHGAIAEAVGAALEGAVPGHRIVATSAIIKAPGEASDLHWHLDPSITDERRWRSLSAWIPLQDVGPSDGSLEVLTGGHRGAPPDRGGQGRFTETHPPHDEALAACREAGGRPSGPLVLAAGTAVLYDHRLPHRSGPNLGARPRVAINVGLLPIEAPLLVHLWGDDGTVRAVPVTERFFLDEDLSADPHGWSTRDPRGDQSGPTPARS